MKISRDRKGGILPFLLILAAIGLVVVVGLPSMELLIRWVSLSRVQNAANEAALVYARDIVRLRDNSLSKLNSSNLTFQESGVPYSCNTQASGGIGSCSPLNGTKAAIPGATSLEYLNASQTLLYNVWGERISDPSEVDDVRQFQCYKAYEDQRFSKIESPEMTCTAVGKVTSPITGLQWEFTANPYGNGVCCPAPGDNSNKDYCVDVKVTGRMDPIIAGGLPFLSGKGVFENKDEGSPVQFITIGDFEIHARAVVDGMSSQSAAADLDNIAGNLSGETVRLESIPNTTCAVAPPPLTPAPNPLAPVNPPALSIPTPGPLPPDTWEVSVPTPDIDIPSPAPNCPPGTEHCQTYSASDSHVSFQCCPLPPSPPPKPPATPPPSDPPADPKAVCPSDKRVEYTAQGLRRKDRTNKQGNPVKLEKGANKDYTCQPKTPPPETPAPEPEPEECFYKFDGFASGDHIYERENGCSVGRECDDKKGRHQSCWQVIQCDGLSCNIPAEKGYYDSNCNQVDSHDKNVCGSYSERGVSPISLVWSDDAYLSDDHSVVQFDFARSLSSKWYTWKAGADMPLLVYDPSHKGSISSSEQLFGNNTFGQKWKNGYEALASLDKNSDQKISKGELKDLALWFDSNRDGVSDAGEVKSLSSVGITELFFAPYKTDLQKGDIYATLGYTRSVNGKIQQGASVDWYALGPFNTKAEALHQKRYIPNLGYVLEPDVKFEGRE